MPVGGHDVPAAEATGDPPRSAPLEHAGTADTVVAVAAFLAEAVLLAIAVRWRVPMALLLIAHLTVVGWLALWLRRRMAAKEESDLTGSALLLVATLATGPLGALGLLVLMPFLSRKPQPSELLDAWYERISLSTEVDPALRLANIVAAKRSIDPHAPAPQSFEALMQRGSLAERQSALGLIARKFEPEYAPALRVALRSPEPVVRVQAAAVAARLRGDLKRKLAAALDKVSGAAGDAKASRVLANDIAGLLAAGLLDDADSRRASDAIVELKRARGSAAEPSPGRQADDNALEARLIADGRFAELRALRKARRLSHSGFFRVRLQGRRATRVAAP
jgi:hypothetical protein